MTKIDNEKIERFFDANKLSAAITFNFFDANGKFATETKKPYVRVYVVLKNGQEFEFTHDEFESFGDRKIHVGMTGEEYN